MLSLWLADRFLGISHRITRRFYKYLLLWMAIAGIFLITIMCLYGPRSTQASSITLQDIVKAANEPVKKKEANSQEARDAVSRYFGRPL